MFEVGTISTGNLIVYEIQIEDFDSTNNASVPYVTDGKRESRTQFLVVSHIPRNVGKSSRIFGS